MPCDARYARVSNILRKGLRSRSRPFAITTRPIAPRRKNMSKKKNRPREREEGEERNNASIKSARQQASLQALGARASLARADFALHIDTKSSDCRYIKIKHWIFYSWTSTKISSRTREMCSNLISRQKTHTHIFLHVYIWLLCTLV